MTNQHVKKMLCAACAILLGVLLGKSSVDANLDVNAISARGQVANPPVAVAANRSVFLPLIPKAGVSAPVPTATTTRTTVPTATATTTRTTVPTATPTTVPSSGCTSPASTGAEWSMLAANPQRTSWTPEEVRCDLSVTWYRPIEPYIPYKVQPIAANGKIYVSTARGLYAVNATNGNLDWVYPTELPLGHSPTIATVNGTAIAYVGGYDHKIHAINANTGQDIAGYTSYEAGAGFETNPLIINNTIYAGNRDGSFYALDAVTGAKKWSWATGGPILYSAAISKDNSTIYFASNDMYAYALNTNDGTLKWKSAKFPGQGFFSYWPVIYTNKSTGKDYVTFNGGENYRQSELWVATSQDPKGETSIFNSYGLLDARLPRTSSPIPGDWTSGTVTMDGSIIEDYYSKYPYRRSDYILDATNGQEYTFTYNGKQTYAPFNYSGVTRGGSKYPPIVNGIDGVFYQQTAYAGYNNWISGGAPAGWKFGTQYLSEVSEESQASDEPTAFSSGGKIIYWTLCCDRFAKAFDITSPLGQPNRYWVYWNYDMARNSLAPGYQQMYNDGASGLYNNMTGWQIYSGKNQSPNGIYGKHSITQSPLIPYQGKLYVLRGNALFAFSATGTNPKTPLPLATVVSTQGTFTPPTTTALKQRLETEVQKMIAAGHLRPGYYPAAFWELYGEGWYNDDREYGEIFDYFQNPADTVATLLLAYPYLSSATQSSVKTYLQTNYGPGSPYDFTKIVHIGWRNGAPREWSDIPPDATTNWGQSDRPPLDPTTGPICPGGCGLYWQNFPPFNFYAAWKYAQIVGNNDPTFAKNIFNLMSSKIEAPPSNTTYQLSKPYFINLYAAGYYGYLQLKQLAGLGRDTTIQNYYNQMLTLRVNNFSKDTPAWTSSATDVDYNRTLSIARNFMFLTPEIGDSMSQSIKSQVQTAMDEYNYVAPYWFVEGFDNTIGEGTLSLLYDSPALFQAKAYILKQPYNELVKWLDVPAFKVGDLFYIQNLVATLSANP